MSPYITEDRRDIVRILIKFKEDYKEALGYNSGNLNAHLMNDKIGEPLTSAFLAQIYEAAGLMKPSCSVYHQMTEIINRNFNLKRDIVEIGSGIFPILGHYLRERQLKLGKGSVTVYDANVWTDYPTKAKLVRSYFNSRVSVTPNSLLVGMFPCEATETMIERAEQEDLEFCIALCGCNHSDIPYLSTAEYHKLLIEKIQDELSRRKRLKIEYFPSSCFGNRHRGFPILIAKEKPKIKLFFFFSKTR